jgi:hypothetical protein
MGATLKHIEVQIGLLPKIDKGEFYVCKMINGYRLIFARKGGGEQEITKPMKKDDLYEVVAAMVKMYHIIK